MFNEDKFSLEFKSIVDWIRDKKSKKIRKKASSSINPFGMSAAVCYCVECRYAWMQLCCGVRGGGKKILKNHSRNPPISGSAAAFSILSFAHDLWWKCAHKLPPDSKHCFTTRFFQPLPLYKWLCHWFLAANWQFIIGAQIQQVSQLHRQLYLIATHCLHQHK